MRYLATGVAPQVEGLENHPPHDYGVAVILNSLADRGVVPLEQACHCAAPSRRISARLRQRSSATQRPRRFLRRRARWPTPCPSRRAPTCSTSTIGTSRSSAPCSCSISISPAWTIRRCPQSWRRRPGAARSCCTVNDDNIIPPAESVLLANHLRAKEVRTRVLLSGLITHASVNPSATAMDAAKLVNFWASVIKQ